MRRTAEETEITRRRVLESAVEVLGESGYSATRLEDIAERAGVTRGAVYHHYGSKPGVLEALVSTYAGGFDRAVEDALAGYRSPPYGGAVELVEALMIEPLELVASDHHLASFFELALLRMGGDPELAWLRATRQRGVEQRLSAIGRAVSDAVPGGLGMSPEEFGRLFVAVQHGVLATWLELSRKYSLADAARQAAQMLIAAVTSASFTVEGGTA